MPPCRISEEYPRQLEEDNSLPVSVHSMKDINSQNEKLIECLAGPLSLVAVCTSSALGVY